MGEGCDFGGCCHPAGEEAFEGLLIGVACSGCSSGCGGNVFAGGFVHNCVFEKD